ERAGRAGVGLVEAVVRRLDRAVGVRLLARAPADRRQHGAGLAGDAGLGRALDHHVGDLVGQEAALRDARIAGATGLAAGHVVAREHQQRAALRGRPGHGRYHLRGQAVAGRRPALPHVRGLPDAAVRGGRVEDLVYRVVRVVADAARCGAEALGRAAVRLVEV